MPMSRRFHQPPDYAECIQVNFVLVNVHESNIESTQNVATRDASHPPHNANKPKASMAKVTSKDKMTSLSGVNREHMGADLSEHPKGISTVQVEAARHLIDERMRRSTSLGNDSVPPAAGTAADQSDGLLINQDLGGQNVTSTTSLNGGSTFSTRVFPKTLTRLLTSMQKQNYHTVNVSIPNESSDVALVESIASCVPELHARKRQRGDLSWHQQHNDMDSSDSSSSDDDYSSCSNGSTCYVQTESVSLCAFDIGRNLVSGNRKLRNGICNALSMAPSDKKPRLCTPPTTESSNLLRQLPKCPVVIKEETKDPAEYVKCLFAHELRKLKGSSQCVGSLDGAVKTIDELLCGVCNVACMFDQIQPEWVEAYSAPIVDASRRGDVEKLRSIHDNGSGVTMRCCNRFGEGLLHAACRRMNVSVVAFLLNESDATSRVRDDYGRTPAHDACWTADPNLIIFKMVIESDPALLLIPDLRGHTALKYVRKQHWPAYCHFLEEHRHLLLPKNNNPTAGRK